MTSISDLDQHLISQHVKNNLQINLNNLETFRCEHCGLVETNQENLTKHVIDAHPSPILHECEFCPFKCKHRIDLKKHTAITHAKSNCDRCSFTSSSQFHLFLHQENEHTDPGPTMTMPLTIPCDLCGLTFSNADDLDSHVRRRHTHSEQQVPQPTQSSSNDNLSRILEEQTDIAQTLKVMQESIFAQLSEIQKNQIFFKDSLNQLSLSHTNQSKCIENLQTTQDNLQEQVAKISKNIVQLDKLKDPSNPSNDPSQPPVSLSSSPQPFCSVSSSSYPSVTPPINSHASPEKHASLEDPIRATTTSVANNSLPTSQSSPTSSKKSQRLQTSKRPKVLFIADSIGTNSDIRHLEEATNTLIYTEKAFVAAYKADAYKPHDNFYNVARNYSTKRNYSFAVLQGSATDITNLDTTSSHHLEYLKQEVTIASKNMISAAENIVKLNPNIKKVLILDRVPRFDTKDADPTHLKPFLSHFGNQVLKEELSKSYVKDKVFVAHHSLPQVFQENLFGNQRRRDFDGVHLRGPDGRNHYTRSLCNILQQFLPQYSRETHNHTLPARKFNTSIRLLPLPTNCHSSTVPTVSSSPSVPTVSSLPSNSSKKSSSSVIINIEPESYHHENYTYSVPTFNHYSALGN